MGTHLHQAVVVTSDDAKLIERTHDTAVAIFSSATATFGASPMRTLVGPIMSGIVNSFRTFYIVPDGSKLGWPDSETADTARTKFLEWCEAQRDDDGCKTLRYVHVQFGGDDDAPAAVIASSSPREQP